MLERPIQKLISTRNGRFLSRLAMALLVLTVLGTGFAGAVAPDHSLGHDQRNFDARIAYNADYDAAPTLVQRQRLAGFNEQVSAAVTFDLATGATRTLYNQTGYLTEPNPASPLEIALGFINQNAELLGLAATDMAEYEITDNVYTAVSGSTHIYFRQMYGGLPLYNGQLQVNINRDGRILSVNNLFMPSMAQAVNSPQPAFGAAHAVALAAAHLGISANGLELIGDPANGPDQRTMIRAKGLSQDDIEAELMWLPIRRGDARLVWRFQVRTFDNNHWYDMTVDAHDGRIWTRFDWVANGNSHRVSAYPAESLQHMATPPPADGRPVEASPADATASPDGWHDDGTTVHTITRGNNVNAYEDSNGSNSPSTPQPDCGATFDCDFDFPIDFGTQEPASYQDAAVSNLFYWNNLIHDVQFHYGFDEAAGNFQVQNFTANGAGGDDVQAEAQDVGNCNANFATPPDGTRPRMQMFICTNASPAHDGDFDNGVIIHEYGHGISNRLVGGPNNVGCLNNTQQGGEGYSDWWSLAYTAEVGDAGTDKRGIGTYLLGQPVDGDGIRPQPYSTDPAINTYTYESINGLSVPHGVGSVWAQVAWEVYWALVDEHGFDIDLHNAGGGSGNHRAMFYVNQGLKNSICSPAFTDVRDGMIQAATDNFGGEDVCLLWETFGAFGLGMDAVSGGPNSTAPTNGFAIPVDCQCEKGQTIPIADTGPDHVLCLGSQTTLGTPALPGHTYLWAPGGETTAQITVSPTETTTYTLTATTDCGPVEDTVTVYVDDGKSAGIADDLESGVDDWTFDGLWHLVASSTCPAPEDGYSSPVNAFYYGQDGSCNYDTGGATSGDLLSPVLFGIDETSALTFDYYRQVESFAGAFDRTEVDIISGGSATNVFALDSSTPSTSMWTSEGPIDLSAFAGQAIQLRFRFNSGDGVGNTFVGWLVDDINVNGTSTCEEGPEIFSDGLESGDTSMWSSTVP